MSPRSVEDTRLSDDDEMVTFDETTDVTAQREGTLPDAPRAGDDASAVQPTNRTVDTVSVTASTPYPLDPSEALLISLLNLVLPPWTEG